MLKAFPAVKYFIILLLFISALAAPKSLYSFYNSEKTTRPLEARDESLQPFEAYIKQLFEQCSLKESNLSFDVFKKSVIGYYNIRKNHSLDKHIITIIDFEKPSKEKRLWIIDIKNHEILQNSLVAHGKNTGNDLAMKFSNKPNSNMSSLGFYLTKNTYIGKHGLSLVIQGLDKKFNSNAEARSVVIHGAAYVSPEFIKCNGRLGRSQGCPALPMNKHKEIINTIAYGSVIFIHHPTSIYNSTYLNEKEAMQEFIKGKNYSAGISNLSSEGR